MNVLFSILVFLFVQQSFAGGAVSYSCVGKNSMNRDSIVFTLSFSDHVREMGYTNQAISIEQISWNRLDTPITLQMFEATAENNCKSNSLKEIYLNGSRFSMDSPRNESLADYVVEFDHNCPEQNRLKVKAYCFFQ